MIIDTHCHFDMMPSPEHYICQEEAVGNIIIGMTNLPSHFQMGKTHLKDYRHIRLALGFHPLLVADNQHELSSFAQLISQTSYIGEIGLDFSRDGYASKDIQLSSLHYILKVMQGKNKIISVHSRKAEKELLTLLKEYEIRNVIFHWYSGAVSLISEIIEVGYYFSINEAMIHSANGQKIIAAIPRNRILTETDKPFNQITDIKQVLAYLKMTEIEVYTNFKTLLNDFTM